MAKFQDTYGKDLAHAVPRQGDWQSFRDYTEYEFDRDKYTPQIAAAINDTPTYAYDDKYGAAITGALNTGPQYEAYHDKYSGRVDNMLNQMENSKFSYDYNTDPAYQAYRKQYLREGQRAMQNTLAGTSAMSGGRPSSWAVTAAAQANNNYAAQLSDKVPELYNQAYQRYLQEFQKQAQTAQLLQNQSQADYNRFSGERNFEYQAGQDYLRNLQTQQQTDYNKFSQDRNFDYNARQDKVRNLQTQQQQAYNMFSTDRDFNETMRQNQIRNMQTQQAQDWNMFMQRAQTAISVGDYKQLDSMGFDTSRADFGSRLSAAQIIAQVTGDTSYIRELLKR